MVDANGDAIGRLASDPFDFTRAGAAVVEVDGGFTLLGGDGRFFSLLDYSQALYFESTDCSGPPAAVNGFTSAYDTWFGIAPVWPETGDRVGYRKTGNQITWTGLSTRFNSILRNADPTFGLPVDTCFPGPVGIASPHPMMTSAAEVQPVPDAPLPEDRPGPVRVVPSP
ncbi:unannotated protein [freshwater metagenome]|uniref:Unannotated protein n=1 Tax=freshwater metagenome TaxID=449393 RepID=A0A6J6G695_9ZZZZ